MYDCTIYNTVPTSVQWEDAVKSYISFIEYCEKYYAKENEELQQLINTVKIVIETLSFSNAIEHLNNCYQLYSKSGQSDNILDLSIFVDEKIPNFDFNFRMFNLLLFDWIFKMPCTSEINYKDDIPSHINPEKKINYSNFMDNIRAVVNILQKKTIREIQLDKILIQECINTGFTDKIDSNIMVLTRKNNNISQIRKTQKKINKK